MATTTKPKKSMHKPIHPGEILWELYLAPLGVTLTDAAKALEVSRKHISAIVNLRAPITLDMARRLAAVFDTDPEIWVNLQARYDIWHLRTQPPLKLKPLRPAA